MKRFLLLVMVLILLQGGFAGCREKPDATEPSSEPTTDVAPGLSLEDDGIVYESLAQKAVVRTALAYLARGTRIQYDDSNMLASGAPTMYRWQAGVRQSPEEYTSQNTGYTNCAAFTYDVYRAALGMKIGGYTTRDLTQVSGKQRIYEYYPTGMETEAQKQQVEAEFRSNLKVGDLIIIRYNGEKEGNGHAMLYVGSKVLEGVEGFKGTAAEGSESADSATDERFVYDIIHSTGSSYKYSGRMEKYEKNGTIQMMSAGSLFDPTTGRYVFSKLKSVVILRPLAVFKKDIPENTLNRMQYMDNIVAEKLSSHPTGKTANPGDTITYTFSITNKNDREVTLAVEDTVPTLATFVSAEETHTCTVDGKTLQWTVKVPPKSTVTVSYDVQIKADAKVGQCVASDKGTVGGVSVPCPGVFVARTLTQKEQADLLAAVETMMDDRLLRGVDLVNAMYAKALKVERILPEDFNSINNSLLNATEKLSYINAESPYIHAVAPGLYGGRNVVWGGIPANDVAKYLRLDAIRTRLPYDYQLIVGDILLAEVGGEPAEQKMFLFTGDRMFDLLSGKETDFQETQACLDPLLSYQRFVILRPSMMLDKQE